MEARDGRVELRRERRLPTDRWLGDADGFGDLTWLIPSVSDPCSTLNHMTLNHLTLPPDDLEPEPDDVPRGICPTCGSGDITHLVIGMPLGPDVMQRDPDWVHWVGCVHPGYDRECGSCGATWSSPPKSA